MTMKTNEEENHKNWEKYVKKKFCMMQLKKSYLGEQKLVGAREKHTQTMQWTCKK